MHLNWSTIILLSAFKKQSQMVEAKYTTEVFFYKDIEVELISI